MRFALILLTLSLAACANEPAEPTPPADTFRSDAGPESLPGGGGVATAVIEGLDGSGVSGTATFREADHATTIRLRIEGLTPGEHGFHIHAGDSCGPDSTGTPGGAARGHFNPLVSMHGAPTAPPSDRHVGDLGNITANAEGVAAGTLVDSLLTLSGATSALGHAVVVHAGRDDLTSQPSGDAGARVGCGLVREVGDAPVVGERALEPEA